MNRQELAFAVLIGSTRIARNSLTQLLPPLIPVLAVALAYPLWKLGLLVTVFTLGSGVGQAPVGHLADRIDRRFILPTGYLVAGASYLLFAGAPQLGGLAPGVALGSFDAAYLVMATAMFFVGIGTSVVQPTVYPMISDNVAEANKGLVFGVFGSAAKFGGALIPLVVGLLLFVLLWEGIVAVLGVFGIGYGLVLFVLLGWFETRPVGARTTAEAARTEAATAAEDHRAYLYPLVVLYVFFITRAFAGKGLRTFIPAFVVGVYGYAFTVAGVDLTAESVANFYLSALLFVGALTQIVLGWAVGARDARKALVLFMLTATAGILALAYLPLGPGPLLVVLLFIGAGIWGLNPARDMLISTITPAAREGRTFGYLWTASSLTSAVIPTVVGYVADVFGLRQSFGMLAVGTLLAAGSILFLYSDRVYQTPPGSPAR